MYEADDVNRLLETGKEAARNKLLHGWNMEKEHWGKLPLSYLVERLQHEVDELKDAVEKNDLVNLFGEAGDVIAFASMIASWTKAALTGGNHASE
jgi:hypothetical protein